MTEIDMINLGFGTLSTIGLLTVWAMHEARR